jgi:hypothetical protein
MMGKERRGFAYGGFNLEVRRLLMGVEGMGERRWVSENCDATSPFA